MEHYVGLDVSLKQTSICVVSRTGSVVREGVVDSDPDAIAAFVRSKAPGAIRVGLETGPTSTWLWTELKRLGLPVICILSTALAWRASMQITGRPSRLSSVHSHVAVGPVSRPIRTAPGAFDLTNAAITSGSELTTPSRMTDPVCDTTQMDVCFNDTSSPT